MRFQGTWVMLVAATAAVSVFAPSAGAITYTVGNNPTDPEDSIVVPSGPFGNPPNFVFTAGIDHDASADTLLKDFTNTSQGNVGGGGGIPSGQNVPITEVFTNDGTEAWTAWDEAIVSTTDGNPPPSPGFLFQPNNVTVLRNGVTLNEGIDYTLSGVPYNAASNNGLISLTISFAPASYIQPSDQLEIRKRIHEVFGDGDIWRLDEAASVAQYPTAVPEPAVVGLLALLGLPARRRR